MKKLSFIFACLVFLVSCNDDRNNPGYSFYPDMEQSQAYDSYSTNPVFKDGLTNQAPVANTVARNRKAYRLVKNDSSLVAAGLTLFNPYAGDQAVLEDGKRLYNIYCTMCHGDLGDGKGSLFTSGKYSYPPASLINDKATGRPDGQIFHIISVGYGIMGAHQGQISPAERWIIIEYIKTGLQTKK